MSEVIIQILYFYFIITYNLVLLVIIIGCCTVIRQSGKSLPIYKFLNYNLYMFRVKFYFVNLYEGVPQSLYFYFIKTCQCQSLVIIIECCTFIRHYCKNLTIHNFFLYILYSEILFLQICLKVYYPKRMVSKIKVRVSETYYLGLKNIIRILKILSRYENYYQDLNNIIQ